MLQERNISKEDSDDEEAPEITRWEAIGWLALLTLWVSVLSGYLVDAIGVRPTSLFFFHCFVKLVELSLLISILTFYQCKELKNLSFMKC